MFTSLGLEACFQVVRKVVHVIMWATVHASVATNPRHSFWLQASLNAAGGHKRQAVMHCIGVAGLAVTVIPESQHNHWHCLFCCS